MARYPKLYAIIAIAFVSISAIFYCRTSRSQSLNTALEYYGFNEPAQKEALKYLFERAAITLPPTTAGDTFTSSITNQELITALIAMVKETQAKFVIRQGAQERWETKPLAWMHEETEKMVAALTTLGFITMVQPSKNQADLICLLGAAKGRMRDRMAFANNLLEQGVTADAIIMLTGERYVTAGVDGTEEELTALAKALHLESWKKLTETDIAKDLYAHSDLQNHGIAWYVIDTPKGDLPRPTTLTTTLALMEWLHEHPEVHHIIFVSNQPYVLYQEAIIRPIIGDTVTFEMVGSAVEKATNVPPIIEGLGSFLWAKTPQVLNDLQIPITEVADRQDLEQLYAKSPSLYALIPFAPQEGVSGANAQPKAAVAA